MTTILNKRILLSLGMIVFVAVAAIGATGAFFSDTETSTGNTFTAGAIDLGVDNTSYYNGALNQGTTWEIDWDLSDGTPRQFFNFSDLKPGDWGEDTISLHVNNNDSYLCADVTLRSDNDNDITEPEGDDGDVGPAGTGNGDLADAVNFYWWADDGDNVFEDNETLLPAGPLGNLAVGGTATIALADSQTNVWGDLNGTEIGNGPLPGDTVKYIAKAWCFGDSTFAAYPATDTSGAPINTNPIARTVVCSGASENNITQTDSMTADISFRAIQSRNNGAFVCSTLLGAITLNPDWMPSGYVHQVMQINYARLADGQIDFTLAKADDPSVVYYQSHGPKTANANGSFEWSYRDQTPAWNIPTVDYEGYNSTLLNPIWASDATIVPAGTPILITITLTKTDGSTQTVTTTYTMTAQDVLDADHI